MTRINVHEIMPDWGKDIVYFCQKASVSLEIHLLVSNCGLRIFLFSNDIISFIVKMLSVVVPPPYLP